MKHRSSCVRLCCSETTVSLDKQRVPKFVAGNCAHPKCYRLCLTYYCDEHYPRMVVDETGAEFKKFVAIVDECSQRGGATHYGKALLLLFDYITLNWEAEWMDETKKLTARELLGCGEFHTSRDCARDFASCDLIRRYAFIVDDDGLEFRPQVSCLAP